jgi:BirA family transcriptional regulator, biotin operon repressor / biotin---[acetyl-CoA-carboxylase] ligase
LFELIQNQFVPEGTIVVTEEQTNGRGQLGNSWESDPGQNLTFSVLLRPNFLVPENQYLISMAVGLALTDMITHLMKKSAKLKWPNDLFLNNRKLGGILTECHIQDQMVCVVGIGLNINQQKFKAPFATSMSLLSDKTFDLNEVLAMTLECLEARYLQLRAGKYAQIESAYKGNLYGLGEKRMFEAEKLFVGIIRDVNQAGQLIVEVSDQLKAFHTKEIRMII